MSDDWVKNRQMRSIVGSMKCLKEKVETLAKAIESGDLHQILRKHKDVRFHYESIGRELMAYLGVEEEV